MMTTLTKQFISFYIRSKNNPPSGRVQHMFRRQVSWQANHQMALKTITPCIVTLIYPNSMANGKLLITDASNAPRSTDATLAKITCGRDNAVRGRRTTKFENRSTYRTVSLTLVTLSVNRTVRYEVRILNFTAQPRGSWCTSQITNNG